MNFRWEFVSVGRQEINFHVSILISICPWKKDLQEAFKSVDDSKGNVFMVEINFE